MIKKFSTKPQFIEVKNVHRTIIRITFFLPHDKNKIVVRNLLKRILTNCNKEFSNATIFRKRIKELSILDYGIFIYPYKDSDLMNIVFAIPEEGIIDDFNMEEAIKFLYNTIYKSNVNNNEFDLEQFNWEKEYLLKCEEGYPHDINEFYNNSFHDFVDEEKIIGLHRHEYLEQLNKVSSKDVYDYYVENILNNHFVTYIYGNLKNKDKINDIFNKYFKQNIKEINIPIEYFNFIKPVSYKEKTINTKYNQSVLGMLYQVENMDNKDVDVFRMFEYFLSSRENDLIFTNLRVNNNLIYHSKVNKDVFYGTIEIVIYFNNNDLDKIVDIITSTINEIMLEDNYNIYKERLLRALKYDIYSRHDEPMYEVDKKITNELEYDYTLEHQLDNMKKITYENMCSFIKRVKLTRKLVLIAGDKIE